MSITQGPRIAVIGVGYVGLTQAACVARLGNDVVGFDLDERKIAMLAAGEIPFHEPGLAELVASGRESGRLRFTTNASEALSSADIVFICVGTPSDDHGAADVSAVHDAARLVGRHATRQTVVVIKSTTPPGSTFTDVQRILVQSGRPGVRATVAINPEFLREGSAVEDFFHPDRVVIGADDPHAVESLVRMYESLGAPILMTDPPTAKLIKYAANAFLATKISFINEIAQIAMLVGANTAVVARGIGLDARIGDRFLDAGLGYGGSCFPKDVKALHALGRRHGYESQLLTSVMGINARQRDVAIEKLETALGSFDGKYVAVLGLAFKPDTDDIREAPAIEIIRRLHERGAQVRAHDPAARHAAERVLPESATMTYCDDPYAATERADALLIATDWPEYRHLDWRRIGLRMAGNTVVDGRGLLHVEEMIDLGFRYVGVAS